MSKYDINAIVEELRDADKHREHINEIKTKPTTNSRRLAVLCKRYLNPQSYGGILEEHMAVKFCLDKKVGAVDGDRVSPTLGNLEIKASLGDKDGGWVLQQIRPTHDVKYYLVMLYNIQKDKVKWLLIPHEDMNQLIIDYGGYAHGVKGRKGAITQKALKNSHNEFSYFFNSEAKKGTKMHDAWLAIKPYIKTEKELKELLC